MPLEAVRRAEISEIPIIDIGELGREAAGESAVVAAIRAACEGVGFFYVTNHGVEPAMIGGIFAECRRFFVLPQGERDALLLTNSPHYRGYLPIGARGANADRPRDLLESFNVARELGEDDPFVRAGKPLHGPNQWPASLPGFRDFILTYYAAMEGLMRRLLEALALAMGEKRGALLEQYRKPLTQLRLLHYPQQSLATGEMIGARPHRDIGVLTILLQDEVGGLEVLNGQDEWVVAPPIPGTFVINLGEMARRMTNDGFVAAQHRVVNRYGKERYSVPFFINPDYDAVLAPLPEFAGSGASLPYEPIEVGQFMHNFYRNLWPSAGKTVT
jgi:isopenicillin N synthase-like dioxygenase